MSYTKIDNVVVKDYQMYKIGYFAMIIFRNKDVFWFDVAMNNLVNMN